MGKQLVPGTDWKESVGAGEEEHLAACARLYARLQAARPSRAGRVVAAHGSLEVLDGPPPFARWGIFARPADYEVWVRLSDGGPAHGGESPLGMRGFALRVFGVRGVAASGGPGRAQDFTLVHPEGFAFGTASELVDYLGAAAQGRGAVLRQMVRRHGWASGVARLARLARARSKAFKGFASESFHSVLPMANGPYAVRMRLVPAASNGRRAAGNDPARDFVTRLRQRPLHWDVQLQYYAGEGATPIDDASVRWPTPYSTVARLMLPRQDILGESGRALARTVEAADFSAGHALVDHRPLGGLHRLRQLVREQMEHVSRAA